IIPDRYSLVSCISWFGAQVAANCVCAMACGWLPNDCRISASTAESRGVNVNADKTWKYLARKPKSAYKQLFVKDRWVAARTLYGQTLGEDARSPEEVAAAYGLPLEVVLEAIAYCESNPPELREDWEREQALIGQG